jgi:excisionase family DNA binding protein
MKIDDIAQAFGVTDRTVKNWLKQGVPRYQAGKILRFDLEKVKEWMETRGEGKE